MDSREEELVCCPTCGLAQRVEILRPHEAALCRRCESVIEERKAPSVVPSMAFALAALIFYVPANIFPILSMQRYGLHSEATVWRGVVELARADDWFVAAVVFTASIAVPLVKLAVLFCLGATAQLRTRRWRRERTLLYRFIELVGPWAMLDVFVLAVLVALVRLGSVATVLPGRGLLAFTFVVVFTLLASAFFDPKLIWQGYEASSDFFERRAEGEGNPA